MNFGGTFNRIAENWTGLTSEELDYVDVLEKPLKDVTRSGFSQALDDDNDLTPEQAIPTLLDQLQDATPEEAEEIQYMLKVLGYTARTAKKIASSVENIKDFDFRGYDMAYTVITDHSMYGWPSLELFSEFEGLMKVCDAEGWPNPYSQDEEVQTLLQSDPDEFYEELEELAYDGVQPLQEIVMQNGTYAYYHEHSGTPTINFYGVSPSETENIKSLLAGLEQAGKDNLDGNLMVAGLESISDAVGEAYEIYAEPTDEGSEAISVTDILYALQGESYDIGDIVKNEPPDPDSVEYEVKWLWADQLYTWEVTEIYGIQGWPHHSHVTDWLEAQDIEPTNMGHAMPHGLLDILDDYNGYEEAQQIAQKFVGFCTEVKFQEQQYFMEDFLGGAVTANINNQTHIKLAENALQTIKTAEVVEITDDFGIVKLDTDQILDHVDPSWEIVKFHAFWERWYFWQPLRTGFGGEKVPDVDGYPWHGHVATWLENSEDLYKYSGIYKSGQVDIYEEMEELFPEDFQEILNYFPEAENFKFMDRLVTADQLLQWASLFDDEIKTASTDEETYKNILNYQDPEDVPYSSNISPEPDVNWDDKFVIDLKNSKGYFWNGVYEHSELLNAIGAGDHYSLGSDPNAGDLAIAGYIEEGEDGERFVEAFGEDYVRDKAIQSLLQFFPNRRIVWNDNAVKTAATALQNYSEPADEEGKFISYEAQPFFFGYDKEHYKVANEIDPSLDESKLGFGYHDEDMIEVSWIPDQYVEEFIKNIEPFFDWIFIGDYQYNVSELLAGEDELDLESNVWSPNNKIKPLTAAVIRDDNTIGFEGEDLGNKHKFILTPEGEFYAWGKGQFDYGKGMLAIENDGTNWEELDDFTKYEWERDSSDTYEFYRQQGYATGTTSSGGFFMVNAPSGFNEKQIQSLEDLFRSEGYKSIVIHEQGTRNFFNRSKDAIDWLSPRRNEEPEEKDVSNFFEGKPEKDLWKEAAEIPFGYTTSIGPYSRENIFKFIVADGETILWAAPMGWPSGPLHGEAIEEIGASFVNAVGYYWPASRTDNNRHPVTEGRVETEENIIQFFYLDSENEERTIQSAMEATGATVVVNEDDL